MNKAFLLLVSISILCGCSTIFKPFAAHTYKLENLEKLVIAVATRQDALRQLGQPDRIIASELKSEEMWLYFEGKYRATRVSLTFEKDHLQIAAWFVNDQDTEANLNLVKSRYASANLQRHDAEWLNAHAGPDEIYFSDEKLGLEIEYSKNRNKVKSIVWRNTKLISQSNSPDRLPAMNFEL